MIESAAKETRAEAIRRLMPLFRELNDLKRLVVPRIAPTSFATDAFCRAWDACLHSEEPNVFGFVAGAVAATGLSAICPMDLAWAGLSQTKIREIFHRAIRSQSIGLGEALTVHLLESWSPQREAHTGRRDVWWIESLARTPRAGATAPGKPKIVLEPPENHADHCFIVAVYGAILAPVFHAEPASVWEIALAHHFHNAVLPDAGFAGEVLLGDQLPPVLSTLRENVLAEIPEQLRQELRAGFEEINFDLTPTAQTFHAADCIDRVLQVEHYARAANFQRSQALDDLNLIHDGPVQAFHQSILADAGLQ